MELRKMPKLDLEKKRGMFFNVGLALSLAIVLTAFEWKSTGIKLVVLEERVEELDEMVTIPPTVQPPPPPPPVQQPQLLIVEDEEVIEEIEVDFNSDFDDDTVVEVIIFEEEKEEAIVEAPVDFAEHMPVPMAGIKEYYKFISKNIKYPNQARRMGVEGKVYVQFVIAKDGSVRNIKTIKGIGFGCDKEAERVMGLSPKWKPGKQGARPVSVRMVLPIHFNLQ